MKQGSHSVTIKKKKNQTIKRPRLQVFGFPTFSCDMNPNHQLLLNVVCLVYFGR